MLPDWFSKITNAAAFANNPANGFQPTLGDAMQGIGNSMMEHYRRNLQPSGTGTPGVPGGGPPAAPAQSLVPVQKPVGELTMPQINPQPMPSFTSGINIADMLKYIR